MVLSCMGHPRVRVSQEWGRLAIEMKLANPMAEDAFEKARKAFFGTVTTTPGAYSVEFLKSRDALPAALEATKEWKYELGQTETVEFANLAFNYRAE